MSKFIAIKEDEADSSLKSIYKDIVNNGFSVGEVPLNFFTSQSERSDILDATWKLTKSLMVEGELPSSVKEMIMLLVSKYNHCRYCEVAHSNALKGIGVSQEEIDSCFVDPELKAIASPQKEILMFALKSASNPKTITEEDIDALRQIGISNKEIIETIMVSAYANFVNTWADASQISLDQE